MTTANERTEAVVGARKFLEMLAAPDSNIGNVIRVDATRLLHLRRGGTPAQHWSEDRSQIAIHCGRPSRIREKALLAAGIGDCESLQVPRDSLNAKFVIAEVLAPKNPLARQQADVEVLKRG